MLVMIDQNKTQHEIEREVQQQNAQLIKKHTYTNPKGTQDNQLTLDDEEDGLSYVSCGHHKDIVGHSAHFLLESLLRQVRG